MVGAAHDVYPPFARPGIRVELRHRPMRFLHLLLLVAAAGCTVALPLPAQLGAESLKAGGIEILYATGGRAFALKVLSECPAADERVRSILGISPPRAKTVQIVADQDELDRRVRAMTNGRAPDWAGAIAIPAARLVFLRADLPRTDEGPLRALLAHEFAHLAVHAGTPHRGVEGRSLPRWIDEGFAQIAAGVLRTPEAVDLRPAAFFGRLLDLKELDAAFHGGEGAAGLAYAESEAFLRHLAAGKKPGAHVRLLRSLLNGVSLEDAVVLEGGLPLEAEWESFRAELSRDKSWMAAMAGQILMAVLFVLVLTTALVRGRARRRAAFERWDAEEAAHREVVRAYQAEQDAASAVLPESPLPPNPADSAAPSDAPDSPRRHSPPDLTSPSNH